MLFVCVFLFNDTATTEIYTYCHTLSLHDALPISEPVPRTADAPGHAGQPLGVRRPLQHRGLVQALSVCCFVQERLQPRSAGESQPGRGRSEEHTSELQSLMRISYAVFCLKKKTTK